MGPNCKHNHWMHAEVSECTTSMTTNNRVRPCRRPRIGEIDYFNQSKRYTYLCSGWRCVAHPSESTWLLLTERTGHPLEIRSDSWWALSSERQSESTWENVKSMRNGIFVDTDDGKLVRIRCRFCRRRVCGRIRLRSRGCGVAVIVGTLNRLLVRDREMSLVGALWVSLSVTGSTSDSGCFPKARWNVSKEIFGARVPNANLSRFGSFDGNDEGTGVGFRFQDPCWLSHRRISALQLVAHPITECRYGSELRTALLIGCHSNQSSYTPTHSRFVRLYRYGTRNCYSSWSPSGFVVASDDRHKHRISSSFK